MTELEDPPRLLDSPDEPLALREALREAQADLGSPAQVARVAGRLGPLLGAAVPAGGTAASVSGVVKASALALAAFVVGGSVWLVSGARPAPSAPTAPAVEKRVPPALAAPPAAPAVSEPSEPVELPAPAASATPSSLPQKVLPPAGPSEADLLEEARSALARDPARALARANQTAARYPRGVLVQEREVIAIQALRRLGRDAEAERRARAFAKAFPGSAFQPKLDAGP